MAFPDDVLAILVELQIGGTWTDITSDVRGEGRILIRRGRSGRVSGTEPSSCSLTLNNRDGKYSPRNPASEYFGRLGRNTPIRISIAHEGTSYWRWHGEVSAWPTRWTEGGHDVWVPIDSGGVLSRLDGSKAVLPSALHEHIVANSPVSYWPLTDGENATRGAPAVGGNVFRSTGIDGSLYQGQPGWGKGSLGTWNQPVIEFDTESFGVITGRCDFADTATTGWSVDWCRAGRGNELDIVRMQDVGDGTTETPRVTFRVSVDPAFNSLQLTVATDTSTASSDALLADVTAPRLFNSDPHHLRVTVTPDGASTGWALYLDGVVQDSGTWAAVGYRPLQSVSVNWEQPAGGLRLGHVTYWRAAPDATIAYRALRGYDGELAGRRIERLCTERSIALSVTGDLDDTVPMGPQRPGGFLELLNECVTVDGGELHEARDLLGLAYRTCRSKYNQGAS